ncbi:unnamed protein product [Cuscuta campestris]|uniref:Cystatin domain-containing protein n=1 Tax=Cuscuta campestris TaxID=132261 RepID=A0A484K409_9ASTE|nr:unnamed protein product [Cuscuta campestris]
MKPAEEVDVEGEGEMPDEDSGVRIVDSFKDPLGTIVEYSGCEDMNTPGDYQDFSDSEDEKTFRQYRKEFLASDGYDITTFYYYPFTMGLLEPIPLEPGERLYEACVHAVQRLITYLREKRGRSLEFVELIKANTAINTSRFYFATFTAMECGKLGTYQARLFRTIRGSEVEIFQFREAPMVDGDQKLWN